MATDRDEQQRQAQELEEIRRSFAEMGARMGSLFEPAEADEPAPPRQTAQPAAVPTSKVPLGLQARPRWWWAAGLVLLFLAGTAFGWVLPRGGDDADPSPPPQAQATTATTAAPETTTETTAEPRTRTSVPEMCIEAARLADEVISRLTSNDRSQRLSLAFRDYTIASQACRREASS